MSIKSILKQYNDSHLTVAVLGSHSALDICRGAKDEGFKTLVVCEKGREKIYSQYYQTRNNTGCVDECLILDSYSDLLKPAIQKILISKNCIFIPHRSFEVYLDFDYHAIEKEFKVPMFGNRDMLKIEERGVRPNQYDLLKKAGIRVPLQFDDPKKIDRLCLVKVLEKERKFERAFFLAGNFEDYEKTVEQKIKEGIFTENELKKCVIEEFILGVQVNFNFFYSPLSKRLELLGTDTRRQTNIEGLLKVPAPYQSDILEKVSVQYEEAGHMAVTVLESMLEKAYDLGEKFVTASRSLFSPGIIGPFALQSIIIPGPPKKDIVVIDISPRMPGSPAVSSTPYGSYLFGESISVGRRVASELRKALSSDTLIQVIT